MDSVLSAALEAISAAAAAGILLSDLWPPLRPALSAAGIPLCHAVKNAVLSRLLAVPPLQFHANGSVLDRCEKSLENVEKAEGIGVRIVAEQRLRDNFLGIYDLQAAGSEITQIRRAVLERLATARTKGVTQSQLSKEFGIKGNNFFYIVKHLESQELVVRQSTTLREKEYLTEGENTKITATNLVFLHRYAKSLNLKSHQKFEILRGDNSESVENADGSSLHAEGGSGDVNDDVSVKDYFSAMKAVCDKLEEADGKCVLASDIKTALGYKKSTGHRAWRSLLNKMKRENLVEEYQAEAGSKNVSCLKLLKKFDLKMITPGHHYDTENSNKHGKRGQVTDQFVELPLDQRIYDIVDAEGRKGITIPEMCKRLGMNPKKLYSRVSSLRQRFAMPWQAETIERTPAYRIWTTRNCPNDPNIPDSYTADPEKNDPFLKSMNSNAPLGELSKSRSFSDRCPLDKIAGASGRSDNSSIWHEPDQHVQLIKWDMDTENIANGGLPSIADDPKPGCLEIVPETIIPQSEKYSSAMTIASNFRSARSKIRECDSTKLDREKLVQERLKKKKMVLRPELYRWLERHKKNKKTTTGRRTLTRILNKFQEEGFCNCIQVSIPGMVNFARHRLVEVIFCPPVRVLTPELLNEIYILHRSFEVLVRREANNLKSKPVAMPVPKEVDRSHHQVEGRPIFLEAMRANGFVPAKMVRAKLLHKFLWGYLRNLPEWENAWRSDACSYDTQNCQTTPQFFSIDESIKMMPYELFLQVVGCPDELDGMVEHCKLGSRLSDIPLSEYKRLMDPLAVSRLSAIIDILIRLKLIQLVRGLPKDDNGLQHAVLMHSMELKPYIEEPVSRALSSNVNADFRPRIRHDFVLVSVEAVDAYWETLEYCYAAADRTAARHAFPGSSVLEVSHRRSWASIRVMSTEQRMKLLQHINGVDLKVKISFTDCVRISRELNLTVEQVLRVYYDKKHGYSYKNSGGSKSRNRRKKVIGDNSESLPRKRTRSSNSCSLDQSEPAQPRKPKDSAEMGSGVGNADQFSPSIPNEVNGNCHRSDDKCDGNIDLTTDIEMQRDDAENPSFIKESIVTRCMSRRRKRIFWSDASDRKIVMQYARKRVKLGAKFYRVDWNSISDLPAPSGTCARRMCILNSNANVRRSVLRLCNLLAKRYASSLQLGETKLENGSFSQNSAIDCENISSNIQEDYWDNFENLDVKTALDEVLQYKRSAKFEHDKIYKSRRGEDWPDSSLSKGTTLCGQEYTVSERQDTQLGSHAETSARGQKNRGISKNISKQSKSRTSARSSAKLLNSSYIIIKKKVSESLAVANAVELIKLVLLNSSAEPQVQISLAKSLQMFSQSDIFAAYSYLKEKNFMVAGHGNQPFVLSRKFLDRASSSPFPVDSGKRATKFSSWLSGKEHDGLLEDGVNLSSDLQCGELFHLFGLVSTGEFRISSSLPKEGTEEAEEGKTSNFHSVNTDHHSNKLKRKSDKVELGSVAKNKKQSQEFKVENDFGLRREKGFPDIRVVMKRELISKAGAIKWLNERESYSFSSGNNGNRTSPKNVTTNDLFFSNPQNNPFWSNKKQPACINEFPWDTITSCANTLYTLRFGQSCPLTLQHELFKSAHSAIHHAGEEGLGLIEVAKIVDIQELQIAEVVVDALEASHYVIKVNSYDNIRVVDFSYRSKYFIQTPISHSEDQNMLSYPECLENCRAPQQAFENKLGTTCDVEKTGSGLLNVHKVTPIAHNNMKEVGLEKNPASSESTFLPILPWINGDGSINTIVFRGLSRRLIGTVMQNPGIMEDDIIQRMDVLNPQSCRKLLELMILDNHISMKMLCETTSSGPPCILQSLFKSSLCKSELVIRKHFFANPMSANLL